MKVYNYNDLGYFLGEKELDKTDICPMTGEWLIPSNSTEIEVLEYKEGFTRKFHYPVWEYEEIKVEEVKQEILI